MVPFVAFMVTFTPIFGLILLGMRSEQIRLQQERRQLVKLTQWAARTRRMRNRSGTPSPLGDER